MDYLAFALLGIGVLLIVSGIFFSNNSKNVKINIQNQPPKEESLSSMVQNPNVLKNQNDQLMAGVTSFQEKYPPTNNISTNEFPQFNSIPPVTSEPVHITQSVAPPKANVNVHVAKENPKLFNKEAHLYLDSNSKNRYSSEDENFHIHNVNGIRRFGTGHFSYDGFIFKFEHNSGVESFPLNSLSHIAFYPNCISLVPKNDLPSALFFLDETESIKNILETFKVNHGT